MVWHVWKTVGQSAYSAAETDLLASGRDTAEVQSSVGFVDAHFLALTDYIGSAPSHCKCLESELSAFLARSVTGSQRHRLVEKEQLGVLPRRH